MTLNKVPNVDDLKRYNLAIRNHWYWGEAEDTTDPVSVERDFNNSASIGVRRKDTRINTNDGTSDEYAGFGSGAIHERPTGGKALATLIVGFNIAPQDIDGKFQFGFCNFNGTSRYDEDDIAVLQIGADNRFRVKSGANAFSESLVISNPIDEYMVAILCDYDAGESKLWVNKSPLIDTADATISQTPNRLRSVGHLCVGGATGDDGTGELRGRSAEYRVWW